MVFADKVKVFRYWYGLSEAELVERAGLTTPLEGYLRFENGRCIDWLDEGDLERIVRFSKLPPLFFFLNFFESQLGMSVERFVGMMHDLVGEDLDGYDKVLLGCNEIQHDSRLILSDMWSCMLPVQMNAAELYEQVKEKLPKRYDSSCHKIETYDLRKRASDYNYSERIKIARRRKRLSQKQLSLIIGKREDFIKEIEESGKKVKKDLRLEIARKAKIPKWYLVGNKEFESKYCMVEEKYQEYLCDEQIYNPKRSLLPHSDFIWHTDLKGFSEKKVLIRLYNFLKKYG